MKRLVLFSIIVLALAWCPVSHACCIAPIRFVYRGTIDIYKTGTFWPSKTLQVYCVITVSRPIKNGVFSSSTIIYDPLNKEYTIMRFPVDLHTCSVCDTTTLNFRAADENGRFWFDAFSNDKQPCSPVTCVRNHLRMPDTMEGIGSIDNYEVFGPDRELKGPIKVTLEYDLIWTQRLQSPNPRNPRDGHFPGLSIESFFALANWKEWPCYAPSERDSRR